MNKPNSQRSVIAGLTLVLAMFASNLQAAPINIDFATLADLIKSTNGNEAHWNSGELVEGAFDDGFFVNDDTLGWVYEKGGLRVQATAKGESTPDAGLDPAVDAYLDGYWTGPGGIGACKQGSDCGGLDNVAFDYKEEVTLTFYDAFDNLMAVTLDASYHTSGVHQTSFTGDSTKELEIFTSINSQGSFDLDDASIAAIVDGIGTGTNTSARKLELGITASSFTFDVLANELYISAIDVTPVPIPAAAWLFVSALGVFGFLGKRARQF